MQITLNSIPLPEHDTIWIDEFRYSPVNQSVTTTLGGRQVIEESVRQKGRPITLEAEWITKATLDLLIAERDTVNNTLVLTVADGRTLNVRFKQGSDALGVTEVTDYAEYQADDLFDVTIKLFEI